MSAATDPRRHRRTQQELAKANAAYALVSRDLANRNNYLTDHATSINALRVKPFRFTGLSVKAALETMSNGCCGD